MVRRWKDISGSRKRTYKAPKALRDMENLKRREKEGVRAALCTAVECHT